MFATNCPAQMPKWTKARANRLVIAADMFGRIDGRLLLATPKRAALRWGNSDRRCYQATEVLKTFFQLRETRGPDQALWIDVEETLTVGQVIFGRVTACSGVINSLLTSRQHTPRTRLI